MILVDSNVLIAAIRTGDPKITALLRAHNAAACGVVRAELLHGVRSAADRRNTLALLGTLGHVPTPDAVWDAVGDNLYALRTNGVTVPFPDAILANLALVNDLELWTRDAHFALIQRVLPALKLFVEPP
jgi:predicted nucleic acid-binding protein